MKKILSLAVLVCIIANITGNVFASTHDKQVFSDVPMSYWAFPYISDMVERGVLKGYTDGTFQPDKPVTRAEAAKMIGSIEDKYYYYSGKLYDVVENSWYSSYVGVCYHYFNKYDVKIDGSTRTCFYPDANAEREDIIVALIKQKMGFDDYNDELVMNRAKVDSEYYDSVYDEYVIERSVLQYEKYNDYLTITESKIPYIEKALSLGILTGYNDNTLRPHDTVTRAEMATLLYKLYGDGNAKDVVLGMKKYKINCTVDEFISKYNENIRNNAKSIIYKGNDNFILEQLYINKAMISILDAEDFSGVLYNVRGETVICCNSNGQIIGVDWDRSSFKDYETTVHNESIQDYECICALMSILNISYDEAKRLLYIIEHNPFFAKCGDTCFATDKGTSFGKSYDILSVSDISSWDNLEFGIYPESQNRGKHITSTNGTVSDFIQKYHTNVLGNFNRLYEDLRYISPENMLISENALISKKTTANDVYMYGVEYESDFNCYAVGNLQMICNTKNEILKMTISPNAIITKTINPNSDSGRIDVSNLEVISIIMALENISYEEAKKYYFSVLNNNSFTSAKGNIYEKSYNEITMTSSEYYSYKQDLYNRYFEALSK